MVVGTGDKQHNLNKKQHQVQVLQKKKKSLSNEGLEIKQIKRIMNIFKDGFMISSHCTMAL